MRKHLHRVVVCIAAFGGCAPSPDPGTEPVQESPTSVAEARESWIDVSLWQAGRAVQSALASGTAPSDAEWDHFLGRIDSPNVPTDSLRRSYRLAFDPRLAEEAASLEGYQAILVEHLRETGERSAEIEELLERLRELDLPRVALDQAGKWLPADAKASASPYPIRVLSFGPDGYAEPASVLVDPLLLLKMDAEDRIGFIAHEYHHVVVRRMAGQVSLAERDPYTDLLNALNQLQLEGIADLVDKGPVPIDAPIPLLDGMTKLFNAAYEQAPETLRSFDARLQELDESEEPEKVARAIRNSFRLAGHPDGYFMAQTILERLGKEALLATLPDPFAFVEAYQRAAGLDGRAPALSAAGVEVLRGLKARAESKQSRD